MNTYQQHFTLSSNVRRERWDGREYIVAPVTMIVPGVLDGSMGALYYPVEKVAKNAQAWNGMPLTIGHPYLNGHPVAANTPGITHIGTVRNAGMSGGRLTGEAWVDVEKVRHANPALYAAFQAGKQLEVSTGLYTQNDPAPVGSTFKGQEYTHIVRDYRPDHLAILTDQRGACNTDHGCGINNSWGNTMNRKDVMPTHEIDWATGEIIITNTAERCECSVANCGCSEEPSDETPSVIPQLDAHFDDDPPVVVNRADIMPTTEIDWTTGEIVTRW